MLIIHLLNRSSTTFNSKRASLSWKGSHGLGMYLQQCGSWTSEEEENRYSLIHTEFITQWKTRPQFCIKQSKPFLCPGSAQQSRYDVQINYIFKTMVYRYMVV